MNLTLIREEYTTESTIGRLLVDGLFLCYTLEDVVRAEGVKIYGETAIPAGEYSLTMRYSPRFKKLLPLIYNMPDNSIQDGRGIRFDYVMFHWGNEAKDSHGCPLLGLTKNVNFVGNSKKAFEKLIEKLGDFDILKLTIINKPT